MKKEANERNSAFDVLRILLALFVIALHFNNSMGGGGIRFCKWNIQRDCFTNGSFCNLCS